MNTLANSVTSRDGTRIAFQRSGTGQPIVLVSPALADRAGSEPLGRLLSRNLTVINYDRRGRGASADTSPYSVEREIEDIDALVESAGGSASLFGSSSGAVLALEAANRLGSKVPALFMYEPPFIVDDTHPPLPVDYLEHLHELISANRRGEAVEYFMTKAVGVPAEMLPQMRAMPMWPSLEASAHTLVYDGQVMGDLMNGKPLPPHRWDLVTAPTLVMAGSNSPAWIHYAAQAVAAVLLRATYRSIEGLDHSAVTMAPLDIATTMYGFFLSEHMKGKGSR